MTPGLGGGGVIRLEEDLPDRGGDHRVLPFGTWASAFLMRWTRQRCQVAPTTRVMAAFKPSWASEIASFTPLSPRRTRSRRNVDQNGSASLGPICSPTISRLPSVLTATAIMAATLTILPPSRTLREVASSHRYGQSSASGRLRKAFTRSSMSLHGLDTLDLEMPLIPIA